MKKFNNFKTFLEENYFTFDSSFEDFQKNEISFLCEKKHKTTLKVTSLANKKVKYKNNLQLLCSVCEKNNSELEYFNLISDKLAEKGHILLSFDGYSESNSRLCHYQCGNCEDIKFTYVNNLVKETKSEFCVRCQNDKNKKSIHEINNFLHSIGYNCITYVNNKNLLVVCKKGHEITSLSFFDYKRDRRCPLCADERRSLTNLEIYGSECVFSSEYFTNSELIKEKREKTMVEKYGTKFPCQNAEILKKSLTSSFRRKNFIFPSGKIIAVQGYEPFCLEDLLIKYEEKNIETNISKMPSFYYIFEEKNHRYYPDIMIKTDDKVEKIIEVKSTYTVTLDFEKNLQKWFSVLENGYVFELRVYDKNKNVEIFDLETDLEILQNKYKKTS